MAQENATAPVDAPAEAPKSETASTNQEQTQTQAPAEAPKQEANANTVTLTDEQKKFFDSNGGLEKVFEKYKSAVANPEQKKEEDKPAEEPKKEATQDTTQNVATQPQPPTQLPKGVKTQEEVDIERYYRDLAAEEQYAPIAKEIRDGSILKEMSEWNIHTRNEQGYYNDRMVRKFLDMKVKTLPPKAPVGDTASATPTADYVKVGENIASDEEAWKVLSQPGHERHDDALKHIAKSISGNASKK